MRAIKSLLIQGLLALSIVLVPALAVVGCGGSSSASSSAHTQTKPRKLTPGAGRGGTHPPVAGRSVPVLIPPPGAPPHSVRVPVLTYHRVAPLSAVGITDLKGEPSNFVAELSALNSGGYHTIHQWQLFDALYKGDALPAKPIIISVDDGYIDDVTRILPALQRFHMVATFFVITGRM